MTSKGGVPTVGAPRNVNEGKRTMSMKRGVVALLGVAVLAGLAGCTQGKAEAYTPQTAATASASQTPPEAPEPAPTAPLPEAPERLPYVAESDVDASCDYILSDPDEFVASVYLTNTGDATGSAEVTVTWKQANGEHIRRTKTVDVPVNKPVEVYLSATAMGSQVSLHQAVPVDRRCSYEFNVTKVIGR